MLSESIELHVTMIFELHSPFPKHQSTVGGKGLNGSITHPSPSEMESSKAMRYAIALYSNLYAVIEKLTQKVNLFTGQSTLSLYTF
jgi:hypothetical protein